MASLSDIIVKPELRPCLVNGKKALFHKWVCYTDYMNGQEINTPAGLVEVESGHVINAHPNSIQFIDNKIQGYCFGMTAGSSPKE